MRSLVLILAAHCAVACDSAPSAATSATDAATGSDAIIADQAAIASEADLTPDTLNAVRGMAVVGVHPTSGDALASGLTELAQADPTRHAYRVANVPERSWFAHGGFGHFQSSTNDTPTAHLAAFAKRIEAKHLDDAVSAAYLELDPRDFPDGQRAEVVYTTYNVGMSIDLTSASLAGTYTETLTAPRVLTNGNRGIFLGYYQYPLELPNLQVNHLETTLSLPAGGHVGDDDEVMVPRLSDRDPRVAIKNYADAMAALQKAHPDITFIYGTVALTPKGNWQRNAFNQMMRVLSIQRGVPLYDAAAILSTGADGQVAFDEQGERLAPENRDETSGGISAAGRTRLAKAWWWLLAEVHDRQLGMHPGVGSATAATLAAFAAPALAAPPGLNGKVVQFCEQHLGQVVGNGQCTELPSEALLAGGGKVPWGEAESPNAGDYVWGTQTLLVEGHPEGAVVTGDLAAVEPGDIVQFRDVKFPNFRSEHHTAVVAMVDPDSRYLIIMQQNVAGRVGVAIERLSLKAMSAGWIRLYRPIPMDGNHGGDAAQAPVFHQEPPTVDAPTSAAP